MWSNTKYIRCGYLMFFVVIGPAIIVASSKNDEKTCGEISSQECLKKLQTFLKLKSLPFTPKESELNKLCSRTIAGYNCSAMKSSNSACLSPRDKDTFPVFVQMAEYTMHLFCSTQKGEDPLLREDFLKNSECILKQKEAIDCCLEGSKLMNFPVMHILEQSSKSEKERQMAACCPVANFLKCIEPTLEKNCGEEAANLTTSYIRTASGEPLEAMCQKMPGYPDLEADICETPPAVCSGSRTGILLELIILMCIVFIKRMSYM